MCGENQEREALQEADLLLRKNCQMLQRDGSNTDRGPAMCEALF